MKHPPVLEQLAQAWKQRVHSAMRVARCACILSAFLSCALLARQGTLPYRLGGAALLTFSVLLLLLQARLERRAFRGAASTIHRVLLPADPELGARALRAVTLVAQAERDSTFGSPELANLHYERLLGRASITAVEQQGRKRAWWWWLAALGTLGAAVIATARGPERVLEGLNVLAARAGRAPFPMQWLSTLRVTSQPPAYLHSAERLVFPENWASEPTGSLITVRGIPEYQDRELWLTDGEREVPFVKEREEEVAARWLLDRTANLRVAARFGGVRVYEPSGVLVRAVVDETPRVELEGAPRTLPLRDFERLELRYSVTDDHGLREVDLVLRTGTHEERRVLSRLDGQLRSTRGGSALSAKDPFLRRAFLPVSVSIEARDDDALSGVKWGKSMPVTLLPPRLGELEVEQYARLQKARDGLTDLLNGEVGVPRERTPDVLKNRAQQTQQMVLELRRMADSGASGLRVAAPLRAFLLSQARSLEKLEPFGSKRLPTLESRLLEVDSALRALGSRDSRTLSKRLGDVAEEIADGAQEALRGETQPRGLERMRVGTQVLGEGALNLQRLGALGRDLGSVAQGELARVERARVAPNFGHAELAARHLAARLRRPRPSFSSSSGSSGKSQLGGAGSESSDAPSAKSQELEELLGELERLAAEHKTDLERAERELGPAGKNPSGQPVQKQREAAEREREFARRAADLARRGDAGEAKLPEDMASALEDAHGLMRQAASELQKGNPAPGLELARRAQRLLEDAGLLEGQGESLESPSKPLDERSSGSFRTDAEVPRADRAHRAEEFRRRVLEGLAREKSPRLTPAVKRYAEELLK